jgi:trigger factor
VKTAVEELSPTRVRLSVEVSFEELKPSLDKAYREVSRQARIPGFRPGKVPPRVIDMRIGRGVVLTEAVNDALPGFYSKAVEEAEVLPLGQPDVDIKQLDDGKDLTFTAEVEIRPRFELPDLSALSVTVPSATVTDEDVDSYVNGLRERFASLKGADRPAEPGDYVSIDLSAAIDGEAVEDAQASGLSYEVGSGTMLDGLDDALAGMSAGDSKTFTSELAGGERAGEQAEVTVTVQSVKVKELPELDDDFAQLASEFDTLEELRADARVQLERQKKFEQTGQAREKAVEALVDAIDMPLPENFVEHEIEHSRERLDSQLRQYRTTREEYLEMEGKTEEELQAELRESAEKSVKVAFVLDALARAEELTVNEAELSYWVADQAQRMGVRPEQLARQLGESGQIGAAATEVLRGKASALVAERVKVLDEDGNEVDVKAQVESLSADIEAMIAAQMADREAAEPGAAETGAAEAGAAESGAAGLSGAEAPEAEAAPEAEVTPDAEVIAGGTGSEGDAGAGAGA